MTRNSLILCIDTGTDVCSVGLACDGELVALRESDGERDHARRVAIYAAEVLKEHGIHAAQLDAVAVGKGPGSYTGLRIGVSLAKGLCYGLDIPLIGIGSLESLCTVACENHSGALFVPMIDARRMEVFGQVFDSHGNPETEPGAWIVDEDSLSEFRNNTHYRSDASTVYIFGSGAEKCREILPWTRFIDVRPSARGMVRLATKDFQTGDFEDTAYFEPFYLKDFIVTASTKKLF